MSVAADIDEIDEEVFAPLLFGYMRRELLVNGAQVGKVERRMDRFARTQGFSMGFTFVERPGNRSLAFEKMIRSIDCQVSAVVLPSLLHFAVLEASHDIKDMFERATGARVLLLDSP